MTRKRKPRSVPAPALTAGTSRATADTSAYRRWWPVLLAALAALGIAAWLLSPRDAPPAAPAPATGAAATAAPAPPVQPAAASAASPEVAGYVGSRTCGECHRTEHAAWQGSQHARAMQHATPDTVLGDFDDARLSVQGVESRFFRRDGRFFVRTDGPDGQLADFEVKYTFGVAPLQQYLVELPGGRLQALALGWDTRPASADGQRWFRQYPDEQIDHRDELHWSARAQNWNFMCADCHSTDVRKGFDADTDAFDTRWSEISVGCEACHGPGSAHLAWSRTPGASDPSKGLTVALDERRGVHWSIDPASGNATRSTPRDSERELQVCAQCHSRRAQLAEGYRAGAPLHDHYLPSTLEEGLYHADGQQLDEVFTWGSFRQSRMHEAGVTCGDCHEPHGQKLRAEGNAVCAQCHASAKYDAPSHHFHPMGSPGAQCVNCHMPATTYMVVDPRRDHGLRVPRPELSLALGTPDACTGCHRNRQAQWAADAVATWYGPGRRQEVHFGAAIDAGRRARPGAAAALLALVRDPSRPAIVRATAIELLARYPGAAADAAIRASLRDADAQLRHAAVTAQQTAAPEHIARVLAPLLGDPTRAVRMEAARVIAAAGALPAPMAMAAFNAAIAEFESAQRENLDRPEAWLNLGNLAGWRGDATGAEDAYRRALQRDPRFVPAAINLADLYRATGREAQAEQVLRDALQAAPGAPALHEALGLTLVRQGRKTGALVELEAAHRAAPDEPRHAYVYAVALADAGQLSEAIRVLEESARRAGGTRDVLLALAALRRDSGDTAGAGQALQSLAEVNPDDPALAASGLPQQPGP
ncbi:MAG: tetratricopeptide repeat protein [Gammaproteobacteria bacterium]|nr:tetratricopeptide repeat protein [Gammaproteobacteria bacterium]